MKTKKQYFANIAGYDNVKAELTDIYHWYQDAKLKNNPDIYLPKAIIFFGAPGNGKTLFMREYIKMFKAPTYIIEGNKKDDIKEIHQIFNKARQEKFAIVVIDEIDLLINRNGSIERLLQSELDGINKNGQILVLATTNSLSNLSDALLRQGRFDRQIKINYPNKKAVMSLYKYYLDKLKAKTNDIDFNHLCQMCSSRLSCVDIKSIVNDAYLRSHGNIDTATLEKSYECLISHDFVRYNPLDFKDYRTAIHEAGHAIMALRFNKDIKLYNSVFIEGGAVTNTYDADEKPDNIERRLERIQIGLAGLVAERLFFKRQDLGSVSDIGRVYHLATLLVSRTCYHDIEDFVEGYCEESERPDTKIHQRNNEKLIHRLIKKQTRLTRRYLKKHRSEIKAYADLLYQKGEVNQCDVKTLFNQEIKETPIRASLLPKAVTSYASEIE